MDKERVGVSRGITRRALIALLLAVLAVGSLIGANWPVQDDGIQVRFQQLNWRGAGKTIRFPNSRIAAATFSFDRSAAGKLVGQGSFVNLVIQVPGSSGREWVVQNLFLQYKDESFLLGSQPSLQFSLPTPNGLRVAQLGYLLTVTPEPLAAEPSGRLERAPVEAKNYRVGGFLEGGSDRAALALQIGPWVGYRPEKVGTSKLIASHQATTRVSANDLPVISESPNGCAPAGVARSIEYMMENQGVSIDYSPQDIYNALYGDMGTTAAGGTATAQDIVDGKAAFVGDAGLDIDTSLHEDGVGSMGSAMTTLSGGGDVEILLRWPDGSGHVAMIASIINNGDGTYTITYVDDPDQTDGVAQNEQVTIKVDSHGNIIAGGTGSVVGVLTETLHSTPPPPPGGSTTPGQTGTGLGGY